MSLTKVSFSMINGADANLSDYIPVGTDTATTDCSAFLQAAVNTGRPVYIPAGVYQLNSAVTLLAAGLGSISTTTIYGENNQTTVLKKIGGGNIFEVADFGRINISSLFFMGANATAIKLASGYSAYIYRSVISNCQFGSNLFRGLDGNFIFTTIQNCTFGQVTTPYQPVTSVASQIWLYCSSGGAFYANMNTVRNCSFGNCIGIAVRLANGGGQWLFEMCDFEVNYQDFSSSDYQQVTFNDYYTEQGYNPVGQLSFDSTDNGLLELNRALLNNTTAGASCVKVGGIARLNFYGCDATGATSYLLLNNNTGSHTIASDTNVLITSNAITLNNTSDPAYLFNGIGGGATLVWPAVVDTGFTYVGGTGHSWTGKYTVIGNVFYWTLQLDHAGGQVSTATTSSYISPMALNGLPFIPKDVVPFNVIVSSTGESLGVGYINDSNGRLYMPAWTSKGGIINMSGFFFIKNA